MATASIPRAELLSWRRGQRLVHRMFDEMGDDDQFSSSDYARDGLPQYDIVADYLARVRQMQDPIAEKAFTSNLTSFLAVHLGTAQPPLYFGSKTPIQTTTRPRPELTCEEHDSLKAAMEARHG